MQKRYLLALLAVSTSAFLVLMYVVLYFFAPSTVIAAGRGWDSVFSALTIAVIPNLIAVLVSFAVIYFLLEMPGIIDAAGQAGRMALHNLKMFYTTHRRVNWGAIYKDAKTLDIGAFYYRSLPADYFEELKMFFRSGGHLRLLVADPERLDLLQVIGTHFFRGTPSDDLAKRIRESIYLYRKAHEDAGTREGKIEVYTFQELFHYTFTFVDGHILYLSPYAQFEEIPQLLSPVTVIDTYSDAQLRDYWNDQLRKFFQSAKLHQ